MSLRVRIILLVVLVLSAALCVRLGLWQRSRLAERRAANARALAGLALPELDLNTARTGAGAHRRVRASGEYDRGHEVIVRGQSYREQPGVHVITPLRLAGRDDAVLVLRGYVPAPDAMSAELDSLEEPGTQVVRGITLALVARADGGGPLERGGRTTWKHADLAALRSRMPYPILDVVLAQAPDSALPRRPHRLPPPALDDGPHLSYTIQWFAFAVIAIVGGAVLLASRRPLPPA